MKRNIIIASGVLIPILFWGCDRTISENQEPALITVTFDQRDPHTREIVIKLGSFKLDLNEAFDLNRGAHKTVSIDLTRFVRFRTWRRFDDNINHKVFILINAPPSWYFAYMVQPSATLIYGDNNPSSFKAEIHAFFIEDIIPVPGETIPLFIQADGFLDSLQVDPKMHTIPRRYVQRINRSMFPAMQDTLFLFITAETPKMLDRRFIPLLGHALEGRNIWDAIWTMELFDHTKDVIGILPDKGIAKDYEAFMLSFKK
jgi:hypothetical protein